MAEPTDLPAPSDLTFEAAMTELEDIVLQLERGETALEQSIAAFERGVALSRRCEDRLNEAEAKVAMLLADGDTVREVDLATGEVLSERGPGE
jgi:exodeoxyribonuclease VII small subunit